MLAILKVLALLVALAILGYLAIRAYFAKPFPLEPRCFIGRLLIDWGPGDRAWVQRADQQNKGVTELRTEFKEPEFPGFLNFIEPLSRLDRLPKSWATVLKSSRGIYLLTCPTTKEQYVGSATGEGGFWTRWQD